MAAFALTELESGSDVANLGTTATDMGDHYCINGAKTLISNGALPITTHYLPERAKPLAPRGSQR